MLLAFEDWRLALAFELGWGRPLAIAAVVVAAAVAACSSNSGGCLQRQAAAVASAFAAVDLD